MVRQAKPVGPGGLPSPQSMFHIANSGGGAGRALSPNANPQPEPEFGETVTIPAFDVDEQGNWRQNDEIEIHPRAMQDDLAYLVRFLLLEDLGDKPTDDDKDANRVAAQKLFKDLQRLANGRGIHVVGSVRQGVEEALKHGFFEVSGGKSARTDSDGDQKKWDNRVLIALFGNDVFNRINDRCAAARKSNRSGFIAGIKHGLAAKTI